MPFDSNGTYSRVDTGATSWRDDATAGIKIRADLHDAHDNDIATALTTCITKDGRSQPSANIPMNQKKIINLGEPDAPADAATRNYVDTFGTRGSAYGFTVTGANYPNGMLHFSATTGTTGISWVNADMSWVGKPAETGKWRQRLCVTNDAQGLGSELIAVDKGGILRISGTITHNLSFDGSAWRVNTTGTGSALTYTNGTMTLSSNDTATLQNNQVATLQTFWSLGQTTMSHTSNSSAVWEMRKKASGQTASLRGLTGTELRWNLELGNSTAESGTAYVGSNFALTAYDNAGLNGKTELLIDRSTNRATFLGAVHSTGSATLGNFNSATTTCIVAAASGGAVYLRPNGPASTTEQCYVSTTGDWHISQGNLYVDESNSAGAYLGLGQRGRNGTTGAYQSAWHNWLYTGGDLYALVGSTNIGAIQMQCDYRMKKDIAALPSLWDKVKALHPISYRRKEYADSGPVDERLRWGFLAHELQTTLIDSAATFQKDQPNVIQGPDLIAVVAALTKALQEAMTRIEALEGAA
jgi:Chaperone of endosialidase